MLTIVTKKKKNTMKKNENACRQSDSNQIKFSMKMLSYATDLNMQPNLIKANIVCFLQYADSSSQFLYILLYIESEHLVKTEKELWDIQKIFRRVPGLQNTYDKTLEKESWG